MMPNDWNLDIAGQYGQPGPPGVTGSTGPIGATGPAGPGYLATSTTSLPIATGSVTVTVQTGLAYLVGTRIRLASNGDPTQWMEGVCTAYSGNAMTVNVDLTNLMVSASYTTYQVWVYTTTGANTWTTPANSITTTCYRIRMVGGGGGGGGGASGQNAAGGGGGEGKEFIISGLLASTAVTLTIGTGGGGGASGGTNGVSGTATSFVVGTTTITCAPGIGCGIGMTNYAYVGRGGRGGATTPGSLTVTMINDLGGQDGGWGGGVYTPGDGGNSLLGLGSRQNQGATGSQAASGYGAGGAGGYAGFAGLAGNPGAIFIERITS